MHYTTLFRSFRRGLMRERRENRRELRDSSDVGGGDLDLKLAQNKSSEGLEEDEVQGGSHETLGWCYGCHLWGEGVCILLVSSSSTAATRQSQEEDHPDRQRRQWWRCFQVEEE